MALSSLLPILFLACTSILGTFVVSDKPDPGKDQPHKGDSPPPPLIYSPPPPPPQQGGKSSTRLLVHFYSATCPNAEDLVMAEMKSIQAEDPTLMPALGCDASVLLVSKNGTAEKDATPNLSLRGFDAIERLKKILEKACPGIVSCADILAMAAREAVFLSNGSRYDIETGRRDGNISRASEAYTNLPPATGNITALIDLYATKNLTIKDLVVLSGAHTFGVSHCSSFSNRLYNFSGSDTTDPTLNSTYAQKLKQQCVPNDTTTVTSMNPGNLLTFNLGYFQTVMNKQGLFSADEALLHNNITLAYVTAQANATSSAQFFKDFAQSMVNMGRVDVLTGTNGTIRAVCGAYVD
ncbi:Peroxidase [Rhynchospora pubera]|uniref:Peroxidase n=2 Tax=Rhynchospora pubera TaxID=906938 RepID=A0AAV8F7H2_9POAL|nr:Peroxidase [Rhynchospora pubera]